MASVGCSGTRAHRSSHATQHDFSPKTSASLPGRGTSLRCPAMGAYVCTHFYDREIHNPLFRKGVGGANLYDRRWQMRRLAQFFVRANSGRIFTTLGSFPVPSPFPPSRVPTGNDLCPGTAKPLIYMENMRSQSNRSQNQPGTRKLLIYKAFPVPSVSSLKREECIGNAPPSIVRFEITTRS